ncbi:MAG: hypothetical protein ACXVBO_14420 [Isosphaeraceae bacterium]
MRSSARGNNFSHYGDLLSDQAAAYEDLRQAMRAHADDETVGQIRDRTPPITEYRAMFADDIAAELTFRGSDRTAVEQFVEQPGLHIALYLNLSVQLWPPTLHSFPKRSGKIGTRTAHRSGPNATTAVRLLLEEFQIVDFITRADDATRSGAAKRKERNGFPWDSS